MNIDSKASKQTHTPLIFALAAPDRLAIILICKHKMTTDVEATEAVMARCTAAGHAAATALASQKAKQATAPNALDSAAHGRSILQLETVINQARLDILEAVTTLSVENKLFALFDALDRNGEGKIPLGDIDSGLRRIGGHSSFTTKVGLAADKLPVLDANGKC